MRTLQRHVRGTAFTVAVLAAFGATAHATPSTSGPAVSLDRTVVADGDRVVLTIDGFDTLHVTISVCGNEARRGSADCNMFASEGLKLDTDGTSTVVQIPIAMPPAPCPCVVRVSSRTNDEIAIAPITLTGHPVEPLAAAEGLDDPLVVSISAQAASSGVWASARTSLGGAATYDVVVTVRNRSTVLLSNVAVAGSAVRDHDQLATLELDDPGSIAPGQTWQQVVSAELPAPSIGAIEWKVTVSGAGPTVTAIETTRQRPVLLIALAMLLVVDVSVLTIRRRVRRRAAHADAHDDALDDVHDDSPDDSPEVSP